MPNPYARRCMRIHTHTHTWIDKAYNPRNAASNWRRKRNEKGVASRRGDNEDAEQPLCRVPAADREITSCYNNGVTCPVSDTPVACRAPRMRNERAIVLRSSNGCSRKKKEMNNR